MNEDPIPAAKPGGTPDTIPPATNPRAAADGSRSLGRQLAWPLLVCLLIYAGAGLVASLIPAAILAARLGPLSGAGDAGAMVAEGYEALVARARITSGVLLVLWLALAWRHRDLARLLDAAMQPLQRARAEGSWRLRTTIQRAWRHHRTEALLLLLILLAGVALRLAYLDRGLRHDEAWTYMVYGRRPWFLNPLILTDVNHHPLNTLLIQLSVALFGNSVPAIRLPAFLFGVACIPAGYALARAVWGSGAALIAAALIAGCSPLIEYSVNARGYTGVTCCALLMLWAGQHALKRGGLSTWPIVALAGSLGCYANIVMILPGIVAFAWFAGLALARGPRAAWPALRSIVLTGLALAAGTLFLYLPFFTVSGWDAIANSQGIKARASVAAALAGLPAFSTALLGNWGRDFWPGLAWVTLALALGSMALARQHRAACVALLGAIAIGVLFQFVVVRDPGPERVWLSLLPPLLILAAAGLDGALALPSSRLAWLSSMAPSLIAVIVLATMAGSVVRSATLLTSKETGYFPPARELAGDLASMSPLDLLAITSVRGDEVTYFALRDGLVLQTVRTEGLFRLFQPVNATARPRAGRLIIVIDKLLRTCSAGQCIPGLLATVPTQGLPVLVRDTLDYSEIAIERSPRR